MQLSHLLASRHGLSSLWQRTQANDRGISLVEVMVASAVFMVVVVSLISLISFSLASRFLSRVESAELKLSQSKMEEFNGRRANDPAFSSSGSPLNAAGDIDFDAPADPQTTSFLQLTLNESRNTKLSFETRCNISTVGTRKIITVATRKLGGSLFRHQPSNLKLFIAP